MNTQKSEKKKINWFKTIRPIALILVLILLLSYSTFAWMKRDWTPTIRESGVRIVAGSSLVFLFKGEEIKDASINDLLGTKDFAFKSVSNSSGLSNDFFALNYSPKGTFFDTFNHLSPEKELSADDQSYASLGKKYGYVDLDFMVKAPEGEGAKQIRLSNESKIAAHNNDEKGANAVKAMRVSITVPNTDTTDTKDVKTIIFTTRKDASENPVHKGITNAVDNGGNHLADGVNRYDNNQLVTKIGEHDLVVAPSSPTVLRYLPEAGTVAADDAIYSLFVLQPGEQASMTVRIWLEGEDADCTDDMVLGGELDVLLKFAAAAVTPQQGS